MRRILGLRRLLPEWLVEADLSLSRKLAGVEVPFIGKHLRPLSNAANKSRLWMAASLLMAVLGGRFGRRAALRGMMSVAATSLVVNVPAKWIASRGRPDHSLVPETRRLLRIPESSSFPSGHSASAFAFAAGAAQEVPWLAVPLVPIATAVAFSRVYTGVHYPSDVIAGAAIGAAIGAAGRIWWPVAPRTPASTRPAFTSRAVQASADGSGLVVVVNQGSGDGSDSIEKLREFLPGAELVEAGPSTIGAEIAKALEGSQLLGVAGGDGTISLAAGLAHDAGKSLLVIPTGTLNHLARDLAIESIDEAVEAVHQGRAAGIDIARIADRAFVNTASFGAYSQLVDAREALEEVIGKWPAFVRGMFRVVRTSTPVDVEIDGQRRLIWMIFIGNCRYHPSGFAPGWRERLDDGLLDIRLIDAHPPWSRTRLMVALLTGTLGRSRVYEEWTARQIHIRSRQGPLRLAADGETFDGPIEFEIVKEDEPLVVYLPQSS